MKKKEFGLDNIFPSRPIDIFAWVYILATLITLGNAMAGFYMMLIIFFMDPHQHSEQVFEGQLPPQMRELIWINKNIKQRLVMFNIYCTIKYIVI